MLIFLILNILSTTLDVKINRDNESIGKEYVYLWW